MKKFSLMLCSVLVLSSFAFAGDADKPAVEARIRMERGNQDVSQGNNCGCSHESGTSAVQLLNKSGQALAARAGYDCYKANQKDDKGHYLNPHMRGETIRGIDVCEFEGAVLATCAEAAGNRPSALADLCN